MGATLGFAFCLQSGSRERYALMLCRSIRLYGGKHKHSPIFALVPSDELYKLNSSIETELTNLQVELIPFDFPIEARQIPFAARSIAAGAAEAYATDKVEQLIYTDVEALFLNDPSLMVLPRNKRLGIRPVDVKNIGLRWDEPLDDFWQQIYHLLQVKEDELFPVFSTVDSDKLKPFFNTCLLTVKPEFGLLQRAGANFLKLCCNPVWTQFFTRDEGYRTFLHQAILTGSLLAELTEDEFEIYSIHVNFTLCTYNKNPHKPQWINELVTCHLDMLNSDNYWKTWLPAREPLRSWLIDQYEAMNLDA